MPRSAARTRLFSSRQAPSRKAPEAEQAARDIAVANVSSWHLTEVSILGVVRPLYGAKPTFVRAALQLAALKLEAQYHPTALPVWHCRASLVAYACCGGERTGFGYSRI